MSDKVVPYLDAPPYETSLGAFDRRRPEVSVDLEFDADRPTILGVCAGGAPVSVRWNKQAEAFLRDLAHDPTVRWVGHNFIQADKPLIEKHSGVEIPLENIHDTMSLLYLGHSNLAGAPKISKRIADSDDPESGSGKGVGLLGLWSLASLYTKLPNWKSCRDGLRWGDEWKPAVRCEGPCPQHDKFWYNALDVLATDQALDGLLERCEEIQLPASLHQRHKRCLEYTQWMQDRGVNIDRELVNSLNEEFERRKTNLFPELSRRLPCGVCKRMASPPCKKCAAAGTVEGEVGQGRTETYFEPFNPRSPKEVVQWFQDRGAPLNKTDKEAVLALVEDDQVVDPEVVEAAERLFSYKIEGKGMKAWFDGRYFRDDGMLHGRFNPCGTGPGRWSAADPNLQNIPKGEWGKKIREVFIPRENGQVWVKADYGQLELRVALWYAFCHTLGQPLPQYVQSADMFTDILNEWPAQDVAALTEQAKKMTKPGGKAKSARDILKSLAYGYQLFEGIKVMSGQELSKPYYKKLREKGALLVYDDWTVRDEYVCFTGVNLAVRLFGSASHDNRRRALEFQAMYAARMPELREWQKSLSKYAEAGRVQTASGRVFELWGSAGDRLKLAATCMAQGGGADYVHEAVESFWELGHVATLQVHDELDWELPRDWSKERVKAFLAPMEHQSKLFQGLRVPVDIEIGENWREIVSLEEWYEKRGVG